MALDHEDQQQELQDERVSKANIKAAKVMLEAAVGRLLEAEEKLGNLGACVHCGVIYSSYSGAAHVQGLEELCDRSIGVCCTDCHQEYTLYDWRQHMMAKTASEALNAYLSMTPLTNPPAPPVIH